MKKYLVILSIVGLFAACSGTKSTTRNESSKIEIAKDSTEYELIVFDPRFNSFMATLPYSKEFYSNSYYQQWNIRYCIEWNIRHSNPLKYGDFYEVSIPYDSSIDYGLDFNFELYHYFLFIEKQYGIVLLSRKGKPVSY